MIYPDEPFYVISGFSPRTDIYTSAFNFCIGLKTDFAMKCLDKEITDYAYNRLEELRTEILKSINLSFGSPHAYPYRFVENEDGKTSCLLRYCHVPGDACDLGIDGMDLDSVKRKNYSREMITYGPHNIDSMKQAYGLLSIWLNWADFAYRHVNSKD